MYILWLILKFSISPKIEADNRCPSTQIYVIPKVKVGRRYYYNPTTIRAAMFDIYGAVKGYLQYKSRLSS